MPDAEFTSYYGKPVIKRPVWAARDIAGYFFLGGLAGASSVLAAGAELGRKPSLARASKLGAAGAISLSVAALVGDLGRPERFVNMLRVLKPTSPMSVGSWLLSAYGPAAGAAALSDVTGVLPRSGRVATYVSAALGPALATYTAVLIGDTAVPAWHDAYREMPFVFAGSATAAAAGLALMASPLDENRPARRLAALGSALELAAFNRMERRLGSVAEPYRQGRARALLGAGRALTVMGLAGQVLWGHRSRRAGAASGACLMAASACTRFGIFHAGMASADDPKYTVGPQRRRLAQLGDR